MDNKVVIKKKTAKHLTIAGWGVVFGGKDVYEDTFTKNTDFHLSLVPQKPVFYDHTMSEVQHDIGVVASLKARSTQAFDSQTIAGLWVEAQLDRAKAYAEEIEELIEKGALGWSSGSVAHLVRYKGDKWQGEITNWPIVEFSLTPTPAEPRTVGVETIRQMKSAYKRANLDWPDELEIPDPETDVADTVVKENKRLKKKTTKDKKIMDEKELLAAEERGRMQAIKDREAVDQEAAERQKEIDKAVDERVEKEEEIRVKAAQLETFYADATKLGASRFDAEAALKESKDDHDVALKALSAKAAPGRRLPDDSLDLPYAAKYQELWKYDDLDAGEQALMIEILNTLPKTQNHAPENAYKALAVKVLEDKDEEQNYRRTKQAMKRAGIPMKVANALNQSDLANFGDEWVTQANSSQLWDKIRLGVQIVGKIPSVVIPQGAESINLPLDGAAPTFFVVAQSSAQDTNPGPITRTVTTSKKGTGKKLLTVNKLGAGVNFTGELVEDSIIPWVSELMRDLADEGAEVLEGVVIDGDTATTASTNINDIADSSAQAGTENYLLFNGFRKLALVTNTANSRSGGAITVEDYLETVKLLGLAGKNAVDKSKVGFIVDLHTQWKSLELSEVKTKDSFSSPTIENGSLTSLWGYPIFTSANFHRSNQDATFGLKANSDGKVDLDTASNNTKGAILSVRWDQWRMGFKRNMTIETTRVPAADATEIVALMRVGMVNRDTQASAISYNLTV